MIEPSYDQNIIVAIKYKNILNWYCSNKFLWIMDLNKLSKEELEKYNQNPELRSIRKDFITISDLNVEEYLRIIKKYLIEKNQIALYIINKRLEKYDEEDLIDFYPVLMVDFDNKKLYSQYPEPIEFEYYIPNNWIGIYENFIDLIKEEDKYWIYNNKNILE